METKLDQPPESLDPKNFKPKWVTLEYCYDDDTGHCEKFISKEFHVCDAVNKLQEHLKEKFHDIVQMKATVTDEKPQQFVPYFMQNK